MEIHLPSVKSETDIYVKDASNCQHLQVNETPPENKSNSRLRFRNNPQIAALMHVHEHYQSKLISYARQMPHQIRMI